MNPLRVNLRIACLLFIGLSGGCQNSFMPGPEAENSYAYEQNTRLGRGVNIGNALEAPVEGQWGVRIKPEYLVQIRQAGFNSIRLPVRWDAHALTYPPYTIDTVFIHRVDEILAQAMKLGLRVIINMHHYDAMVMNPGAEKNRFLALWRQIAEHYATYTDWLYFELLNEPCCNITSEEWNTLVSEAITVIRDARAERTLIVGLTNGGGTDGLGALHLPRGVANIIVTFHYYSPFVFTHQGAEWIPGAESWKNVTWEGTAVERDRITEDFQRTAFFALEQHLPVNLGEYGAYGKAPYDSRVTWTKTVTTEALRQGMSMHYWEFCAGFGLYDTISGSFRKELMDAVLK